MINKFLRRLNKWKRIFGPSKSLLDLPNELILGIARYLSPHELDNFIRANRFLHMLLSPVLSKRALLPSLRVGKHSTSVLRWATRNNHIPMLKLLLSQEPRFDVNAAEFAGLNALHSALLQQNTVAVKLLLKNGADVNTESKAGLTPLSIAVVSGNKGLVKILLEKGADPNETVLGHGRMSPLHHAAALGHMEIIDLLIEMGCNTAALDKNGFTAAGFAAANGRYTVLKRLESIGVQCETLPDRVKLNTSICTMDNNLSSYGISQWLDDVTYSSSNR